MNSYKPLVYVLLTLSFLSNFALADVWTDAQRGFAQNGDVEIHYATLGEGPLVIMIHGFPDFWYSWRDQMEGLKDDFKVVAMDQRGYNYSGKPEEESSYNITHLTADVAAIIRHFDADSATIVGHDWGGIVAWQFAFAYPEMVDKLVVLDMPHPNGLARELAANSTQYQNSAYARTFMAGSPSDPDVFFGGPMNANTLSGWVTDAEAREKYVEAFERSSFDGMLAYYKQNYPRIDYASSLPELEPKLNVPVLIIHGLQDIFLLAEGLNNSWEWNDSTTTILTIPSSGHFVQQDASGLVTQTLRSWLTTVSKF